MVASIFSTQQDIFRYPFTSEALALFSRMTVQPDITRKILINSCIVSLKSAGVWSKLDCLYLSAAHDAQAARRNWISDNFNLSTVNAPTFTTDRGYAGDGTTSYLNTGWKPAGSSLYTESSAVIGSWINAGTNAAASTKSSMGVFAPGSTGSYITPRSSTNTHRTQVNSTTAADFGTVSTILGLTTTGRAGSNTVETYRNGVSAGTQSVTTATRLNIDCFLLGINNNGTPINHSNFRVAAAMMGGALDSTEQTALYNALNTYLTAIGGN